MKVVVTGGAGLIGSVVVDLLLKADHQVTVFDKAGPTGKPNPSGQSVLWMRGNTEDFGEVLGALAGSDAVIHLAALTRPGVAPDQVLFRNNVLGTYNVHEAAFRLGIKRVITAGSAAVTGWPYGQHDMLPEYLPIDEAHPLRPHDPYGLAKLCEEEIARSYSFKCGMETAVLRQSWVLFEPERAWLYKAGGNAPSKANFSMAYIDVRDTAAAFCQAAQAPRLTHEVLFVCADDTTGREPLAESLPRISPELGEMSKNIRGMEPGVSNKRAKQVLKWEPRHSWRTGD